MRSPAITLASSHTLNKANTVGCLWRRPQWRGKLIVCSLDLKYNLFNTRIGAFLTHFINRRPGARSGLLHHSMRRWKKIMFLAISPKLHIGFTCNTVEMLQQFFATNSPFKNNWIIDIIILIVKIIIIEDDDITGFVLQSKLHGDRL